jgi:hypothetical protein
MPPVPSIYTGRPSHSLALFHRGTNKADIGATLNSPAESFGPHVVTIGSTTIQVAPPIDHLFVISGAKTVLQLVQRHRAACLRHINARPRAQSLVTLLL